MSPCLFPEQPTDEEPLGPPGVDPSPEAVHAVARDEFGRQVYADPSEYMTPEEYAQFMSAQPWATAPAAGAGAAGGAQGEGAQAGEEVGGGEAGGQKGKKPRPNRRAKAGDKDGPKVVQVVALDPEELERWVGSNDGSAVGSACMHVGVLWGCFVQGWLERERQGAWGVT